MLRACEQRMLDTYSVRTSSFQQGYDKGVQAARDAVEMAWTDDPSWNGTNWNNALHEALVAIDTLRGNNG